MSTSRRPAFEFQLYLICNDIFGRTAPLKAEYRKQCACWLDDLPTQQSERGATRDHTFSIPWVLSRSGSRSSSRSGSCWPGIHRDEKSRPLLPTTINGRKGDACYGWFMIGPMSIVWGRRQTCLSTFCAWKKFKAYSNLCIHYYENASFVALIRRVWVTTVAPPVTGMYRKKGA